jgi:hypothetical protein
MVRVHRFAAVVAIVRLLAAAAVGVYSISVRARGLLERLWMLDWVKSTKLLV